MKFSQRIGKTSAPSTPLTDGLSRQSLDGLWNIIRQYYITFDPFTNLKTDDSASAYALQIWHHAMRRNVDDMSAHPTHYIAAVRKWFDGAEWFVALDFVEQLPQIAHGISGLFEPATMRAYRRDVNRLLERDVIGFRFVGNDLVPLTSETEIQVVTEALKSPVVAISQHFASAVALLSDKSAIDHRNSVKESISGLEACVQYVVGKPGTTLGEAIKLVRDRHGEEWHPALKSAIGKLYGWASDADGIRHALKDDSKPVSIAIARFTLVTCSAIASLLLSEVEAAGGRKG